MSGLPILIDDEDRNQWEFEQYNACCYDKYMTTVPFFLHTHPKA
jgi:hypothetical protein